MAEPPYAMNQPSFAEMYERHLVGPLFRPWAEVLLDRVQLGAGDRLLDLACGTGIVARLARDRLGDTGRIVGADLSPLMLSVARTVAPGIEWREANAASLPFERDEFEVVTCHQGLQFFPDKPAAVREMRRVLVRGGRVAVATWGALEDASCFLALHRVAERHLGPITDHRHSFGDGTALAGLLADAGFHDVHVERMSRPLRFDDPATFVRMNAMALVGMSAGGKALTEEQRGNRAATIASESADVLPRFADGTGIAFAITANVATARAG